MAAGLAADGCQPRGRTILYRFGLPSGKQAAVEGGLDRRRRVLIRVRALALTEYGASPRQAKGAWRERNMPRLGAWGFMPWDGLRWAGNCPVSRSAHGAGARPRKTWWPN